MPTVKLVNFKGEEIDKVDLSDVVFGSPVHAPAMHQVVVAQLANRRQGTQSAKTRGEVAGGGKKPWRQKHTGRARHGSIRSPLWAGGGVVHAPKPRDYHQKVNKKVRRLAMRSALSLKVNEELFTLVQSFDLEKPSTKEMSRFFNAIKARKPLVLVKDKDDNVVKSVSNIEGARIINVNSINVYDILNAVHLIATPDAVKAIEEVYSL